MSDSRISLETLLLLAPRNNNSNSSAWDFTRQPLWNLRCHNRDRRMRFGPKHTKAGSPHHQNALVVGPFRRHAALFVRIMRESSRMFRNRCIRGLRLAAVWHELDPAQQGERVRLFAAEGLEAELAKQSVQLYATVQQATQADKELVPLVERTKRLLADCEQE
jgi:hypothetical protein